MSYMEYPLEQRRQYTWALAELLAWHYLHCPPVDGRDCQVLVDMRVRVANCEWEWDSYLVAAVFDVPALLEGAE